MDEFDQTNTLNDEAIPQMLQILLSIRSQIETISRTLEQHANMLKHLQDQHLKGDTLHKQPRYKDVATCTHGFMGHQDLASLQEEPQAYQRLVQAHHFTKAKLAEAKMATEKWQQRAGELEERNVGKKMSRISRDTPSLTERSRVPNEGKSSTHFNKPIVAGSSSRESNELDVKDPELHPSDSIWFLSERPVLPFSGLNRKFESTRVDESRNRLTRTADEVFSASVNLRQVCDGSDSQALDLDLVDLNVPTPRRSQRSFILPAVRPKSEEVTFSRLHSACETQFFTETKNKYLETQNICPQANTSSTPISMEDNRFCGAYTCDPSGRGHPNAGKISDNADARNSKNVKDRAKRDEGPEATILAARNAKKSLLLETTPDSYLRRRKRKQARSFHNVEDLAEDEASDTRESPWFVADQKVLQLRGLLDTTGQTVSSIDYEERNIGSNESARARALEFDRKRTKLNCFQNEATHFDSRADNPNCSGNTYFRHKERNQSSRPTQQYKLITNIGIDLNKDGRQRRTHGRAPTPPGIWETEMVDTQKLQQQREIVRELDG